jgi:hypothetical protein
MAATKRSGIFATSAIILMDSVAAFANDMSQSDPYNTPQNAPERWHHIRHHGTRFEQEHYLEENGGRIRFLEEKIQMLAERDAHLRQMEIDYIEKGGSPLPMIEMRQRVHKDQAIIRQMVHEVQKRKAIQQSLEHGR